MTNLREMRESFGLTQQEAAERIGVSKQCWSRIETGARKGSLKTWMAIRLAFRVPRRELLPLYSNRVAKTNNGGRKKKTLK